MFPPIFKILLVMERKQERFCYELTYNNLIYNIYFHLAQNTMFHFLIIVCKHSIVSSRRATVSQRLTEKNDPENRKYFISYRLVQLLSIKLYSKDSMEILYILAFHFEDKIVSAFNLILFILTCIKRPHPAHPAQSSGPVRISDDDSGLLGPIGSDFNSKQDVPPLRISVHSTRLLESKNPMPDSSNIVRSGVS